ncbi:hypothetical protein [Shewanella sp. ALD9]|nr:hypothetical protein [Shewanella sp. ALD9]
MKKHTQECVFLLYAIYVMYINNMNMAKALSANEHYRYQPQPLSSH